MGAVHRAPTDYPSGKAGDVLTVEFTVAGIPCIGLNGGPAFQHSEAFSFQIATDNQAETDRLWDAIVGNGGQESACGWCKDCWGLSWQITPRALTSALAAGGEEAKRAFAAMMTMRKIDIAVIEAARAVRVHTPLDWYDLNSSPAHAGVPFLRDVRCEPSWPLRGLKRAGAGFRELRGLPSRDPAEHGAGHQTGTARVVEVVQSTDEFARAVETRDGLGRRCRGRGSSD
jgi:predicted 3-demethylubiquinone-9 3-methyltransferase (glyoxalase superfamily)